MKVIVTGSNSSVGSSFIQRINSKHDVITLSRCNSNYLFDLDVIPESFTLPYADVLVHTAASFGGKTFSDIYQTEKNNVLGTLSIINKAIQAGIKHIVLISTIYTTIPKSQPQYSIYSISKKHCEEVSRYFCENKDVLLTILRPAPVYGIGKNYHKHQPFFYSIIANAQQNKDLIFYGKNDALRNYIFIDDLCTIIEGVIENKICGTFNCVHTENISLTRIAKAAIAAFYSKSNIIFDVTKPDILDLAFKNEHNLYEDLNLYSLTSIEIGVRKIADSFREIQK